MVGCSSSGWIALAARQRESWERGPGEFVVVAAAAAAAAADVAVAVVAAAAAAV